MGLPFVFLKAVPGGQYNAEESALHAVHAFAPSAEFAIIAPDIQGLLNPNAALDCSRHH